MPQQLILEIQNNVYPFARLTSLEKQQKDLQKGDVLILVRRKVQGQKNPQTRMRIRQKIQLLRRLGDEECQQEEWNLSRKKTSNPKIMIRPIRVLEEQVEGCSFHIYYEYVPHKFDGSFLQSLNSGEIQSYKKQMMGFSSFLHANRIDLNLESRNIGFTNQQQIKYYVDIMDFVLTQRPQQAIKNKYVLQINKMFQNVRMYIDPNVKIARGHFSQKRQNLILADQSKSIQIKFNRGANNGITKQTNSNQSNMRNQFYSPGYVKQSNQIQQRQLSIYTVAQSKYRQKSIWSNVSKSPMMQKDINQNINNIKKYGDLPIQNNQSNITTRSNKHAELLSNIEERIQQITKNLKKKYSPKGENKNQNTNILDDPYQTQQMMLQSSHQQNQKQQKKQDHLNQKTNNNMRSISPNHNKFLNNDNSINISRYNRKGEDDINTKNTSKNFYKPSYISPQRKLSVQQPKQLGSSSIFGKNSMIIDGGRQNFHTGSSGQQGGGSVRGLRSGKQQQGQNGIILQNIKQNSQESVTNNLGHGATPNQRKQSIKMRKQSIKHRKQSIHKQKTRKQSINSMTSIRSAKILTPPTPPIIVKSKSPKQQQAQNINIISTSPFSQLQSKLPRQDSSSSSPKPKKQPLTKRDFEELKKNQFQSFFNSKQTYVHEFLDILQDEGTSGKQVNIIGKTANNKNISNNNVSQLGNQLNNSKGQILFSNSSSRGVSISKNNNQISTDKYLNNKNDSRNASYYNDYANIKKDTSNSNKIISSTKNNKIISSNTNVRMNSSRLNANNQVYNNDRSKTVANKDNHKVSTAIDKYQLEPANTQQLTLKNANNNSFNKSVVGLSKNNPQQQIITSTAGSSTHHKSTPSIQEILNNNNVNNKNINIQTTGLSIFSNQKQQDIQYKNDQKINSIGIGRTGNKEHLSPKQQQVVVKKGQKGELKTRIQKVLQKCDIAFLNYQKLSSNNVQGIQIVNKK